MYMKRIILLLSVILMMSGCDVAKQLGGAFNMTQCKYDYNSISNLAVGGVDLSQGLSLASITRLTQLFTGNISSLPLNFNVNVDVTNPNTTAAFLNGMQYILSIDGVQFTTGSLNQTLNIASGEKQTMPLTLGFDVAQLLTGNTKDAVLNIVKNFVGIGSEKSQVTLQIKPSFQIGNSLIPSPVYIPISFAFGGGK